MLKRFFKPHYMPYDPKFIHLSDADQQAIEQTAKAMSDFVDTSKKISKVDYHTRAAHAKGYCLLKAKLEILDNLPEAYAQGLYASAKQHDAVIRWSNAAPFVARDSKLGPIIGMAIKVFDVPGKKLAPGEEDCTTFDFNLVNFPIFFCNSVQDYEMVSKLFLKVPAYLEKGIMGKAKFGFDWLTHRGARLPTTEALKTLRAARKLISIDFKNPLLYAFHSIGAVRHGDYMAKIRVIPTPDSCKKISQVDLDITATAEAIRPMIINEIREHDYEFELQIQLCHTLKKQPIDDLTKDWQASKAPFITVARLTIPRQDIPEDGHFEIMEQLSFTPFRCLARNRPIGNLQQSRLKAYEAVSKRRHKLNKVQRQEPQSLEATFNKTFF